MESMPDEYIEDWQTVQAFDALQEKLTQAKATIAKLEEQLARTWQPIKSPEYRIRSYGAIAFVSGEVLSVQNDMQRQQTIILPDNIRLCRLQDITE